MSEKLSTLRLRRPDDFHLHLRDGAMLETVLPYTTKQFARALIMPNLQPPIIDLNSAQNYRERIVKAAKNAHFTPLMSAYLCDNTDAKMLEEGFTSGVFTAAKYYPAGATTHSEYGVTSATKISQVLETMQKIGMPLLIHGESTQPEVDIFDREARFLDETLCRLCTDFPALKIVLEHITTKDAAGFVASGNAKRLAATITPQHLLFNRNEMFIGGIRPHLFCLPILKRRTHQEALRKAATSGNPRFFAGTDSAPHAAHKKEAACGCAGIFNAPVALAAYATVFEAENALLKLEAFTSENGANFYGLALNEGLVTLERVAHQVIESVKITETETLKPFLAGETIHWRLKND